MIQTAAQVVPLKLNTEKDGRELAAKYGVQGLPTILFVDATGKKADGWSGYLPPDEFRTKLNQVTLATLMQAQADLRKNPGDGKAAGELALAQSVRGEFEAAEESLQTAVKNAASGPNVGRAFLNVAENHRANKRLDAAIKAFKEADRTGREALIRAHAKLRLMECYETTGDKAKKREVARALSKLEGAPPEYVEAARKALEP